MSHGRLLITGGAGFVGSSVAIHLANLGRASDVVALDNLHRRGSELAMERLAKAGVRFVHGDVRRREDLESAGRFGLIVECSAEPSVHAGYDGDPSYVLGTNLTGAIECLEAARRWSAGVIFLSTSRVYPIDLLRSLPLVEGATRLHLEPGAAGLGWSADGISTDFPLIGHRSLYGATKLAAELLLEEYRQMYGVPVIINRCGVIAGPWQMGKVDQGFVALWAARHLWGDSLSYIGFGGRGLQVRDVLHVDDLATLIGRQRDHLASWSGEVFNVGGGPNQSVSLLELTTKCIERAERQLTFEQIDKTTPADIPYYVTDNGHARSVCDWAPSHSVDALVDDVFGWLRANEPSLRPRFA
jgi:CDP-paratose 2-epimerase